jgi:hypothetical protein
MAWVMGAVSSAAIPMMTCRGRGALLFVRERVGLLMSVRLCRMSGVQRGLGWKLKGRLGIVCRVEVVVYCVSEGVSVYEWFCETV